MPHVFSTRDLQHNACWKKPKKEKGATYTTKQQHMFCAVCAISAQVCAICVVCAVYVHICAAVPFLPYVSSFVLCVPSVPFTLFVRRLHVENLCHLCRVCPEVCGLCRLCQELCGLCHLCPGLCRLRRLCYLWWDKICAAINFSMLCCLLFVSYLFFLGVGHY